MMSEESRQTDRQLAYAMLRVLLGVNIAIHGISRIVMGVGTFAAETTQGFARTLLPMWSVYGYATALPFAEAVLGVLLLVGLGTRAALITGQGLMISLTFGSALKQDWNAAGWQLLYGVVYTALLAGREYNALSFDGLRRRG